MVKRGTLIIFLFLPSLGWGSVKYGLLLGGRGGYQDTSDIPFLMDLMRDGEILNGIFIGYLTLLSKYLDFAIRIDTRELSETTLEGDGEIYFLDTRLKRAYLIDELYTVLKPSNEISIKAGKKEIVVFDGIILQNYLAGLELRVDLYEERGIPFILSTGLYKAEKKEELLNPDSFDPVALLKVDYPLNLVENLSFSFLFFYDSSNFFGTMMNNALQQVLLPLLEYRMKVETDWRKRLRMGMVYLRVVEEPFKDSRGPVYWFNFAGKKYLWRFLIKGGFSFEFGNSQVKYVDVFTGDERSKAIDFSGGAAFLKVYYRGMQNFEPFFSFLFMSGNEGPFDFSDEYESFLTLYQYITETSMFYSGGINTHFSTGSISPSGLLGYGNLSLIAGLRIKYFFDADIRQAFLLSPVSPKPLGEIEVGMVYGYETDIVIKKNLWWYLDLLFEGAIFIPGSFFTKDGILFRIIGGVDFSF